MKAVMMAAPSSGSGKTTLTMAIIRVLKNRGLEPTCFKTGPDYIDTAIKAVILNAVSPKGYTMLKEVCT